MTTNGDIHITAQPARLDPNSCTFTVDRTVHPGGPYLYESTQAGEGSPLPQRLFALEGIASVLVQDNVVTINKNDGAWKTLAPQVGRVIREQLTTGVPAILKTPEEILGTDDEAMAAAIRKVLERQVNPAVGRHRGSIQLIEVRDGSAYVIMSGGCQGCGKAQLTLGQGVEVMLKRAVPGLKRVVDTTDHGAGESPYYARSAKPGLTVVD